MSLQSLNIVFCINQKYCFPCFVTMQSLLDHLPDGITANFFILYYKLNTTSIGIGERLFNTPQSCVQFIDCTSYFPEDKIPFVNSAENPHHSKENYLPLLIPSIFSGFGKTIFLDADMLIRGDISQLPALIGNEAKMGAVPCMIRRLTANINRPLYDKFYLYSKNVIKLKQPENYCNSGVIVFNHDLITQEDMKNAFTLLKHRWEAGEEAIFNKLFEDSLILLPVSYNFYQDAYQKQPYYPKDCYKEWVEAHKNPLIFHYLGKYKPWNTPGLPYNEAYNHVWKRVVTKAKEYAQEVVLNDLSNPQNLISR